MGFQISGAAIHQLASTITLDYSSGGTHVQSHVLDLGSLLVQEGTLNTADADASGTISAGETIDHDNADIPLLDTVSDLSNATVLAVGTMSGVLDGVTVSYTVLLVEANGSQHLVYPDGTPDLLNNLTGAITTTLTFYPGAHYTPGGGITCFASGTAIATPQGSVVVETLQTGDLVTTRDHGAQPIRWIGSRRLGAADLALRPHLRPIRIRAGALGAGLPARDLLVSPQHRIALTGAQTRRVCGVPEVLVAARNLLGLEGVDIATEVTEITYWHLLFDRHQLIVAEGAVTESLFPGPEALKALSPAARWEICAVFPELARGARPAPARPLITGRQARALVERIGRARARAAR